MRIFSLIQSTFSDSKLLTLDNSTPQTDPSCANFEKHNIVTSEQIFGFHGSSNMRVFTVPTRYIISKSNTHMILSELFSIQLGNGHMGRKFDYIGQKHTSAFRQGDVPRMYRHSKKIVLTLFLLGVRVSLPYLHFPTTEITLCAVFLVPGVYPR